MDYEQQQKRLYQKDQTLNDYVWVQKNQFRKLFSGFVHDQNFKVKMGISNMKSTFKIQQKLSPSANGKGYEVNGNFLTWNMLSNQKQQTDKTFSSFSNKLSSRQSIIFGVCKNNVKLEWRLGQKQFKRFNYNPFVCVETPNDVHQFNITVGCIHKSKHLNLLTKLSASILHSIDLISKLKIQYAKNQMYFGLASQITQGVNFKISKGLLGYQFSPKDYFYLRFKTQNIGHLIKGKPTYQQVGFYYLRKINQNLKFSLGVKSVNSIQNTLNFVIETKTPYNVKAKIDSKFNLFVTAKKQFAECSSISYGIGIINMFQKKSRIQTGFVYQYNS